MTLRPLVILLCLALPTAAQGQFGAPMMLSANKENKNSRPSITGITLSNNSFSAPGADGTVVGSITVHGNNNSGAQLSISGTNASAFRLSSTTVPSNLLINGTQCSSSPPCTYSINILATLTGGSPFTQSETITGAALAAGFIVDGASLGGACSDAYSNAQGLVVTTPFCTVARAQTAMRATSTKLTYIRAATYTPSTVGSCGNSSLIAMTSADANETLQYYPSDNVDTAIFDGGSTASGNGVAVGIEICGPGITVNGLQFQRTNTHVAAIYSPNTLFENNSIHNDTNSTSGDAVGCVFLYSNPSGSIITHNYVFNCGATGIGASTCAGTCANGLNNVTISYNFVENACSNTNDCGGIYLQDYSSPRSTGINVTQNYVRNVSGGGTFNRGIYLDDGTSNVTLSGNVASGGMTSCWNIHGGASVTYTQNICDESSSGGIVVNQGSGVCSGSCMSGNSFAHEIIIASAGGAAGCGYGCSGDGSGGLATINNNIYFNYGGSSVVNTGSGGAGNDSNPTYANPLLLTCPSGLDSWSYKLSTSPASPAFNSPISFPAQGNNDVGIARGQPGFWGPPGFRVPHVGTAPSYAPTC